MEQSVIVTGGAGYIGSHLCKTLAKNGYLPVVYDSFKTGHRDFVRWGPYVEADVLDTVSLKATINTFRPQALFHLAADSHVRTSILEPLSYYQNNVGGTISVLQALAESPVPFLVFSSSASIYGKSSFIPIKETHPLLPAHPYGKSKMIGEQLIEDFCLNRQIQYAHLRYFNAAGADPDNEIGERHTPETHLIPLLIQVLKGELNYFSLFCDTHNTPDGTARRDFVHVSDLAEGHVKTLEWLKKNKGNLQLNLGSGMGYTLLEVISLLEAKAQKKIEIIKEKSPIEEPSSLVADVSLAQELLSWSPKYSSLDTILETALRWHR